MSLKIVLNVSTFISCAGNLTKNEYLVVSMMETNNYLFNYQTVFLPIEIIQIRISSHNLCLTENNKFDTQNITFFLGCSVLL